MSEINSGADKSRNDHVERNFLLTIGGVIVAEVWILLWLLRWSF